MAVWEFIVIAKIRTADENSAYLPICAALIQISKGREITVATSYPQLVAQQTGLFSIDGRRMTEYLHGIQKQFAPDYVVIDNLRTPAYDDYFRGWSEQIHGFRCCYHDKKHRFIILERLEVNDDQP
ncbi:MAG: hypothetical protein HQL48_10625 [Gammaproteobacteria bacterium]|nr:hypothetical protein [Gammaproteobacteria bacterium]